MGGWWRVSGADEAVLGSTLLGRRQMWAWTLRRTKTRRTLRVGGGGRWSSRWRVWEVHHEQGVRDDVSGGCGRGG